MMRNLFIGILLVVITLGYSAFAANSRISLSIDDIHSPVFSAKGIRASLSGQQLSQLEFRVGEIAVQGKIWRNVKLSCIKFQLDDRLIGCFDGRIQLPNSAPFAVVFRYIPRNKNLEIEIRPTADESWQFSLHWNENYWRSALTIDNGQTVHAVQWLPNIETMPIPGKGRINGNIKLSGSMDGIDRVATELRIDELAFSDLNGLRAGEDVSMAINLNAEHSSHNNQWLWQSEINWLTGEIFWQPLYFSDGGYSLNLSGILNEKNINLHNGKIVLHDIGELDFSGVLARPGYDLIDFSLQATSLELSAFFDQILRPFLRDTAFSEMSVIGHSSFLWRYYQGANQSLVLDLHDVSLADQRDRFAFYRVNAHIPWQVDGATIADISILSGQVLRVPLGAVRVPLEINQSELRIPQLVLPVLDGKLKLENFIASQQDKNWHWQFHGELLPVSMEQLTRALQIQQMHGTISGVIPKVSYANSIVTVDGTLLFNIFDGIVTAKNLRLIEPLGLVPHLTLDLAMKNLDLNLLTRAFSFGNMQGRIDMEMQNLELASWRPVKFDAQLSSSAGSYPRRISQAAIQNITALGGASAVAAIQRSFLRFFEEFAYSKIGWQCSLRNNVCRMDGIEPASILEEFESQGYVIVKGGGVPAITVIGYNRNVGWQELINRLKRITQGNDPVIQ
jgi:hypothetical protein